MKFDPKLAELAQELANKKEFAHSGAMVDGQQTGENIYMGWTTVEPTGNIIDVTPAISSWYHESDALEGDITPDDVTSSNPVFGHFTQVVWDSSNRVGCGASRWSEEVPNYTKYYTLVFCNYLPAGNWVGEVPYQNMGHASCPACSYSAEYGSLCL